MHTTDQPHDRHPQKPRRTDIPADPDTLIDVAPAYLAGRSYANQVFERLTGEWAWGHSTATELSQSFAWSPDHRFRLADGQLDPGAWWHIAAARDPLGPPQWQAGFSKETPPEFVAAVAEELARTGSGIDWTGETAPALQAPTDRRTLIHTLQDAGWRSTYRNGELDLEAPDRLARVQIRIDPPGDALDLMSRPHLYVEIGPRDNGGYPPYWQAMATTGTPTVVVDALARALTDPTPLARDRDWMDEELLEHLGETAANDKREHKATDQPAAGQSPPYTDEDLLTIAISLATEALESIVDFHYADMIDDQVIPSTRTTAGRIWNDLPKEQKHLAHTLVTDLVVDAARRAPVLFGREPDTGPPPRRVSRLPTPPIETPLQDLWFTNADLHAAAAWVSDRRMYWGPSALSDAMRDETIHSTAGHAEPRTGRTLPDEHREEAIRRTEKLINDAAERAATLLFDRPSSPEPLTLVSPLYLAGPGHHGPETRRRNGVHQPVCPRDLPGPERQHRHGLDNHSPPSPVRRRATVVLRRRPHSAGDHCRTPRGTRHNPSG